MAPLLRNNKRTKAVIAMGLMAGGLMLAGSIVAAPLYNTQTPDENFGTVADAAGQTNTTDDLGIFVGKTIGIILSALGIIVLAYLIYGGVLWMTAAGNEDQVTKAKSIIRNGIIGVLVIASAYAISYFVVTRVGGAVGIK
ncbi:MAG: hypothetical protein AAB817_01515 [Patescibacteria group bacterium]